MCLQSTYTKETTTCCVISVVVPALCSTSLSIADPIMRKHTRTVIHTLGNAAVYKHAVKAKGGTISRRHADLACRSKRQKALIITIASDQLAKLA